MNYSNLPDGCTPEMVDASFGDCFPNILWDLLDFAAPNSVTRAEVLKWVFEHGSEYVSEWIVEDAEASKFYDLFMKTSDLNYLDKCLDLIAEAANEVNRDDF